MPDDVKKQVLELEVRNKKAVSEIDRVVKRGEDLIKTAHRMGAAFRSSSAPIDKQAQIMQRAGQRVEELRRQIHNIPRDVAAADRAFAQSKGAQIYAQKIRTARSEINTIGRLESGTRGVASTAGQLGATGASSALGGGAEFLNAAQGIQQMRTELPALATQLGTSTVALGALGVGLGALGLAANELKKSIEKTGDVTRNFIETNKKYAEGIATGTTEEVEKLIKAEKDRQKALLIERDMLDEFMAQQGNVDSLSFAFLELNKAVKANYGGVENVKDRIEEINNIVGQSVDVSGRWEVAIQKGLTASADAEEAEKKLAEARLKAYAVTLLNIDSQAEYADELRRAAGSLMPDQVEAAVKNFELEQDKLRDKQTLLTEEYAQGIITLDEYLRQTAQAQKLIDDLSFKIADWNTYVLQAAIEREKEVKAIELLTQWGGFFQKGADKLTGSLQGVTDTVQNATATLDEYRKKQAEVDAERGIAATREAADYLRQRNYDLTDHYAKMAELDADYYVDRGDIISSALEDLGTIEQDRGDELRSLNKDLEGLARDHAENMYKINRDATRTEQRAARQLDAAALYDAQLARKDAIEDENSQYKKERDEREDQFNDRLRLLDRERDETDQHQRDALRALERQHQKGRQSNEAAFRETLRREDEERRIKANRQAADYAREDAQRMAHYNVIEATTAAHQNNVLNIHKAGMAGVEQEIARRYAAASQQAAMSAPIQRALSRSTSALISAGASVASAPSTVFTAPTSRTASTSIQTLNINVPAGAAASQNTTVLATAIRKEFERMITRD